jgi:hypothetical protein
LVVVVAVGWGAFAAIPAQASVSTLRGTVVQSSPGAHTFVLATRAGRMVGITTRRSPRVGGIARVSARRLRGGRFSAHRVRIFGRRSQARIRGTVRFVNRDRTMFRVSVGGASVRVYVPSGARWVPRRGNKVDIRVAIDRNGRLKLVSRTPNAARPGGGTSSPGGAGGHSESGRGSEGTTHSSTSESTSASSAQGKLTFIDGVVVGVNRQERTLTVAPEQDEQDEDAEDGEDRYGLPITIVVRHASELSRFAPGQEVGLVVRKQPSGTLMLEDSAIGGNDDDSNDPQNTSGDDYDPEGDLGGSLTGP